jgi:DNA-directed RNA polymerase subunit RPC12/RpoP
MNFICLDCNHHFHSTDQNRSQQRDGQCPTCGSENIKEEGMKEKPPVLSDEDVRQWLCKKEGEDNYILFPHSDAMEAQRDADVEWYKNIRRTNA